MSLRATADGVLGILQRDWRVFLSYRVRVATQLLSAFFTLTLFYYISRLVKVGAFQSSDEYYAYVVVGLVILQVLNSTLYFPPSTLQSELFAGTFERVLVSPFGPVASLCATMVFPFLQALATGVMMLVFASLVFGLPIVWSTAALALPVAVLGTVAFATFGIALVGSALVVKQVTAGTTWIVAGISLIAGLYFPVSLLPGSVQWLSDVQPFSPTVELMRNALVGTSLQHSAWVDVAKIVGFAVVLMPASVWILSASVRASRRRATVLEY